MCFPEKKILKWRLACKKFASKYVQQGWENCYWDVVATKGSVNLVGSSRARITLPTPAPDNSSVEAGWPEWGDDLGQGNSHRLMAIPTERPGWDLRHQYLRHCQQQRGWIFPSQSGQTTASPCCLNCLLFTAHPGKGSSWNLVYFFSWRKANWMIYSPIATVGLKTTPKLIISPLLDFWKALLTTVKVTKSKEGLRNYHRLPWWLRR